MSRCFPYPPPGYVRNPVALSVVETTTKLQKEREKADRKKEKRNEKKALKQGGGDTSKHSKHSHKKRKHEDSSILEPQNASKDQAEPLEKSGLTEEHGVPFFTQTSYGSPESSQDSSKRRKAVLPSPSQNKNGSILRIKIRRDQDSPAGILDNPRVLEQPLVQQMGTGSSLIKQNLIQPHVIRELKTVAAPRSMKRDSQAVVKQVSAQPPANVQQRVDPSTTGKVTQKRDPMLSVNPATGRPDPPSAKVMRSADPTTRVHPPTKGKVTQKMDPMLSVNPAMGRPDLPSAKMMRSADPRTTKLTRKVVPPPEEVVQRVNLPPAKTWKVVATPEKVVQGVDLPPAKIVQTVDNSMSSKASGQQPPLLQKPSLPVEMPLIQQSQQINSLPQKEEPCFSGRNMGAAAVPELKQSKPGPKRNRKAEKKEKKLGDLFVTWNPPSFEMEDAGDLGTLDWLLGDARKPDASLSDCTAIDGLAPLQAMEQQSLLQPRAVYLPDLDVYQLPYVVPF